MDNKIHLASINSLCIIPTHKLECSSSPYGRGRAHFLDSTHPGGEVGIGAGSGKVVGNLYQ